MSSDDSLCNVCVTTGLCITMTFSASEGNNAMRSFFTPSRQQEYTEGAEKSLQQKDGAGSYNLQTPAA